uniref:Uncharacterized protein n=1 Tax=Siphoviridae sp. ctxvK3 TaxID=2827975 RepID=A0A8S5SG45_9CAUD|nr:MAG TPA: hypothetical protein [Siphoviridae sp. ctxvK3]
MTNLAFSIINYSTKTATIKYVAVSFLLVPIIGTRDKKNTIIFS